MDLPARVFPLGVCLLDLYLTRVSSPISCPNHFHSLGIIALWVASKAETQKHLHFNDVFYKIGHCKFSRDQLQRLEFDFLKVIDFDISLSIAYDRICTLLRLLEIAFHEIKDMTCFPSLAYLCFTNYVCSITVSSITQTYSQHSLAGLCLLDALLKYSPVVLGRLQSGSPSFALFLTELEHSSGCTLGDLKKAKEQQLPLVIKFNRLMSNYDDLVGKGLVEGKWVQLMVSRLMQALFSTAGPFSPPCEYTFNN